MIQETISFHLLIELGLQHRVSKGSVCHLYMDKHNDGFSTKIALVREIVTWTIQHDLNTMTR
jgi:hypothetical protein